MLTICNKIAKKSIFMNKRDNEEERKSTNHFSHPENDKKSDIECETIVLAHYSHLPGWTEWEVKRCQ